MKTLFAICCILFLLHATSHVVESRPHRADRQQSYKLFVFGDSFADNGNTDKEKLTWWTRNWYHPYGVSDDMSNFGPTGRFSDGKVQSDFIAMILGHDESPAPENHRDDGVDPFGMNFAVAFADVKDNTNSSDLDPNSSDLAAQIHRFRRLLKHGLIDTDISRSVALIAFSGVDYTDIPDEQANYNGFARFINRVTDSIADGVSDLLDLGVTKVLVNLMQPMGCSPRYTRTTTNYTECIKDDITEAHNRMIQDKLGSQDSVLLLDLHNAFIQTIHPKTGTGFWHRHIPCCESFTPDGYCGQVDRFGLPQYQVCDEPDKYFYFDDWHPTQAGWTAIMDRHLGEPIKEFLNIH